MFTGRVGNAEGHGCDSQCRSPALLAVPGHNRDQHRLDGAFSLHRREKWCLKRAATLVSCLLPPTALYRELRISCHLSRGIFIPVLQCKSEEHQNKAKGQRKDQPSCSSHYLGILLSFCLNCCRCICRHCALREIRSGN